MTMPRKEQIRSLLKGIETGDPAVAVVNEEKHIQHNPQTHEGSEGRSRVEYVLGALAGQKVPVDGVFVPAVRDASSNRTFQMRLPPIAGTWAVRMS